MRRKAEPARAEALWDEESFIAELKPQLLRVPLLPEWITDTRLRQLYRYTSAVEQWNRRINLVGQMNRDFLALHLLDSLAALPVLFRRPFQTAVDIGSGAGLPGIPLALFTPDCRWTLVERSAKRAGFLRTVAVELGLQQQVEVRETQAEFVTETFDLVVFRAFSPVSRVFPLLKQRVAAGGRLVAYKGKAAAVFAETEALKEPLLSVVPLTVPLLKQERHLLIYESEASLLK